MDVTRAAHDWLAVDPDPETRAELEALIAGPRSELEARFDGRLQFGTAGLRAALGAGPQRMNRVIVRRTAAAVGRWLVVRGLGDRGVVVGYDGRKNSEVFAHDSAGVLATLGVRVYLLRGEHPTPVVATFATKVRSGAAVVVTASHNPPADNGYKVFLGDGSQIVPPVDAEIAALIVDDDDIEVASLDHPLISACEVEAREWYHEVVTASVRRDRSVDPSGLRVAYTPLHGVGRDVLLEAFARTGLAAPYVVTEQAEPDAAFPTVSFPNPEEPGSMDLVLDLARTIDADLVLANDPDADRLGMAIPVSGGGFRVLKGDEIGWLFADHLLRLTSGPDRLVVTTLVSSSLLAKMAAAHGVQFRETFTGFKWIGHTRRLNPNLRFVMGYEQALGYLVTDLPNDKDGIAAAVLMTEIAASVRAAGSTLEARLAAIEATYGRHVIADASVRLDPAVGQARVRSIARNPPTHLAGREVTRSTWVEEATLLRLWCGDSVRVQIRPSGTEPKVKVYVEVIDSEAEAFIGAAVALLDS